MSRYTRKRLEHGQNRSHALECRDMLSSERYSLRRIFTKWWINERMTLRANGWNTLSYLRAGG